MQAIAQRTNIKRTTIYDLINDLKQRGLITQTVIGKKRLFLAEDPETVINIFKNKEREFEQIIPELKSLYYSNISALKPRMRYYEGIEGSKKVLEDSLSAKEKTLRCIMPLKDIIDLFGEDYFQEYTKKRIRNGYTLKSIRPSAKEIVPIRKKYHWVSSYKEKREVRYAPKNFTFSMTMYLYDQKVSFISSKKESFGIIIESQELAENQRAFFEVLWQISQAK